MKPSFILSFAHWCAWLPILAVAVVVSLAPFSGGASQGIPEWYLVLDHALALDEGQERSAINDAYRLNLYGIPTQIVTEGIGLDQAQSNARADELRVTHGIESAPGADDGLLIYASIDRYDRSQTFVAISVGAQTLPRNGLDQAALDRIRRDIVAYQLGEGRPARAVVYSLREMIYLEQYVPPPAPETSGWRATMQPVVTVAGPTIGLAGIASLTRDRREDRGPASPLTKSTLGWSMVTGALAFLTVETQSTIGVLSAILLGASVIATAIRLDQKLLPANARILAATPRPPANRTALRPDRSVPR
ncbi:MAG: hypothetical protein H0V37_06015 [Chloroflexia bacterium]|nr:hypothetical protein [Chloroflexia bacterium]